MRTITDGTWLEKSIPRYLEGRPGFVDCMCWDRASLIATFLVCVGTSSRAQFSPRIGRPGQVEGDLFGTSIASAGDVDGDGVPDIVVGSGAWSVRPPDDPSGYVLSGKTGKLLFAIGRDGEVLRFGNRSVCGTSDLDGDGHSDVTLVAWHSNPTSPGYFVTVFSGADGKRLWEQLLTSRRRLGDLSVTSVGDLDGDRIADVAVEAGNPLDAVNPGSVMLFSGRSGCLLAEGRENILGDWRWQGSIASIDDLDGDGTPDLLVPTVARDSCRKYTGGFGIDALSGRDLHRIRRFVVTECADPIAASAGDVDRDGVPDLLVSGTVPGTMENCPTFVRILSGRDGGILAEFMNPSCFAKGSDMCRVGDVDHDGWTDVLLSEYEMGGACSGVRVLSGRDAHLIRTIPPPIDLWGPWPRYLGYAVADAGDVDQDGYDDIALASATPWGDATGFAEVYSGRTGEVLWLWTRESVEHGGAQRAR